MGATTMATILAIRLTRLVAFERSCVSSNQVMSASQKNNKAGNSDESNPERLGSLSPSWLLFLGLSLIHVSHTFSKSEDFCSFIGKDL